MGQNNVEVAVLAQSAMVIDAVEASARNPSMMVRAALSEMSTLWNGVHGSVGERCKAVARRLAKPTSFCDLNCWS